MPVPDSTETPARTLKAMMLPAPVTVPPIVLLEALLLTITPLTSLPSGALPVMSVPMQVPRHEVARRTGAVEPHAPVVGRDQVLSAAEVVPPIVLPVRAEDRHALLRVGHGGQAGLVGADQVAGDQVPGRGGPGDDHALVVARDHLRALGVARDDGVGGVVDPHALEGVAQVELAGDVGADQVVADHGLASRPAPEIRTPRRLPEITLPGPIDRSGARRRPRRRRSCPSTALPSAVRPMRLLSDRCCPRPRPR